MDAFFEALKLDHWDWYILAAILMVLEMVMPGVIFLWMAIAGVVVGSVVLFMPDLGWEMQVISFAVLSIVTVYSGRRYLGKHPLETEDTTLNRRGESHVGKSYKVVVAIEGGRGRVQVGDSQWTVEGSDAAVGDMVKVVAVEGTILIVE